MRRYILILVMLLTAVWQISLADVERSSSPEEMWGSPFGHPFKGAAISLRPSAAEYKLGQRIDLSLRFRNVGKKKLTLQYSGFRHSCRIALFYADGRPVPKSRARKDAEDVTGRREAPTLSTAIMLLGPGETETGFMVITLNPLFQVDKEGSYLAVVMYTPRSWADGFAISNLARFEVTGGEDKSRSDPQPSGAEQEKGK